MPSFVPSPQFVAQLKRHEGFYSAPYVCPAGVCTIGYGTNLEAHPKYMPFEGIRKRVEAGALKGKALKQALDMAEWQMSGAQAEAAMLDEVGNCHGALMLMAEEYAGLRFGEDTKLDGAWPRADVILNMTFNLGVHGYLKFRQTRSCIAAHDYDKAAEQMQQSAWYRQVGVRSKELCEQMRQGRYIK